MLPTVLSLGIVYLLAVGAGRFSAAVGVPRVTGYLIAGLVAGPAIGDILGVPAIFAPGHLKSLAPLHDVVLGLIVFTIGGSFSLESIRKSGPALLRISAVEMGLTAILVGFGTFLFFSASPLAATFLAIVSITTAPAATQMVMREYQAEGPLSEKILPLIGINNLVAIVAFIVLENCGLAENWSFSSIAVQLFLPFGAGVLVGIFVALMDQRLTRQVDRQILIVATVSVMTGLGTHLDFSAMLSSLVAGLVVVNASPNRRRMVRDLAKIDYPLYVLFFIMAGAALHLEHLGHMGAMGVAYVALRSAGKYFGCRLGAFYARTSRTIKSWLGPAMLAQAGLAIGLAEVLARQWPGPGEALQTVILASVVVFEMVGPLITRFALVNAGEVTVHRLLTQRSQVAIGEGLAQVLGHFRKAIGLPPITAEKGLENITVGHIMRRNVEVLPNRTPFDEILKAFGNTRYDRLPVANDKSELIGVIRFSDIADILFHPSLGKLVVAHDIARDDHLKLNPEDSLQKAMEMLKDHPNDSYLLVVARDNPRKLVGIVRQNDVLSTQSSP